MKMLIVLFCFIITLSCKEDSNKKELSSENQNTETSKTYKDKEIEEALYKGYFIKNNEGYDITVFKNHLYLLKNQPSNNDKNDHFFLELNTQVNQDSTIDILPQEFFYNESLSDNFNNVAVYKYPLPIKKKYYDILIGQFNNNGRIWSTYLEGKSFIKGNQNYKNEYFNSIKTNRFLNEFDEAFDEGYFIQHQENFDLLIDKSIIYYIIPKTLKPDLETQFYLHVTYENNQDNLNIDFNGKEHQINQLLSLKYENFIILKKNIPNKGNILEIGTGQFNAKGRTWGVLYNLPSLYDNMAFIYNDQYKELIK